MGEHTVKLYTRQNDKTLYQLERDGRHGKLRLVYKGGVQKTSKA